MIDPDGSYPNIQMIVMDPFLIHVILMDPFIIQVILMDPFIIEIETVRSGQRSEDDVGTRGGSLGLRFFHRRLLS